MVGPLSRRMLLCVILAACGLTIVSLEQRARMQRVDLALRLLEQEPPASSSPYGELVPVPSSPTIVAPDSPAIVAPETPRAYGVDVSCPMYAWGGLVVEECRRSI